MYVSSYVCAKSALKHSNRTHNGVLLSEISSSSDHEEIVCINLATAHNHYILQCDGIKVYCSTSSKGWYSQLCEYIVSVRMKSSSKCQIKIHQVGTYYITHKVGLLL